MDEGFLYGCCCSEIAPFTLRAKLRSEQHIQVRTLRNSVIQGLRPSSDAVLHMSRIEFNELSSCEVPLLNQFETADIIRIGSAVLQA